MHKHYWEATDMPGICICVCKSERMFNRFTQSYEVYTC
jgi:hypothetical protein